MRIITNKKWQNCGKKLVSTEELLQDCDWLSISQLGVLTSTTQVHNIILTKEPRGLYDSITHTHQPATRQLNQRKFLKPSIPIPNLQATWKSWKWRAVSQYNSYPSHITNSDTITKFKDTAKSWIKKNIDIN